MSDLLKKLQEKQSDYTAKNTETHTFTITSLASIKDPRKVMVKVKEIDTSFFCFREAFGAKGVPVEIRSTGLTAQLTFTENGEYVNLTEVDYRLGDLDKYAFLATSKQGINI